jgi:hypothetical protein
MSNFGEHFFAQNLPNHAQNRGGIGDALSLSMNKTSSLYVVAITLMFAAVVAHLRAMFERHVPVGYQDETGFHLGNEPVDK